MKLSQETRDYFSELGRKGGKSKSKLKIDKALINMRKAIANRWKNKSKIVLAKTKPIGYIYRVVK